MLVRKYVLVVTLFVFTWKTAQPFILLTAKVDDIEKIAEKFVSKELAEKLAQSIVTVIEILNSNNETNIDNELQNIEYSYESEAIFDNESSETEEYNKKKKQIEPEVDQHRFSKVPRNRNVNAIFSNRGNPKTIYKKEHKQETSKYLNNWDTSLQSQLVTQFFSEELSTPNSKSKSASHQKKPRHSIQTQTTNKPIKNKSRHKFPKDNNYRSNEVRSHYAPKTKPNWNHESKYKNKKLFGDRHLPDRKKPHQRVQLMDAGAGKHINNNASTVRESVIEPRLQIGKTEALTTKQDKNSYIVNKNFLATSGLVILPAAPVGKQWWEKKLPVSNQHRQNQPIETRTTNNLTKSTIHPKISNIHNYKSNEVKSRYVIRKPFVNLDVTLKNKTVSDNNRSSDLKVQKPRFQLMNADDVERTKQPDKVVAKKNGEYEKLTTKRERNEFDQYENLNYPKMRAFLATSGPVVLSAAPVEKQWWEKDLPK